MKITNKKMYYITTFMSLMVLLILISACMMSANPISQNNELNIKTQKIDNHENMPPTNSDNTASEINDTEFVEPDEDIITVHNITYTKPDEELYLMGYSTYIYHNPFYIVIGESIISDIDTSFPITTFDRDANIATNHIPSGFYLFFNGYLWEVWKDLLVRFDPQQSEYIAIRIPVGVYGDLLDIMKRIGITSFNQIILNDITLARLDVISADMEALIKQSIVDGITPIVDVDYTQTITSQNILKEIETIFANIEFYEAGCPFDGVFLTLTTGTGEEVILAIARDGCDVFFVNGVTYKTINLIEILFTHFDQIPISVIIE